MNVHIATQYNYGNERNSGIDLIHKTKHDRNHKATDEQEHSWRKIG
jgi:hypothetical protein